MQRTEEQQLKRAATLLHLVASFNCSQISRKACNRCPLSLVDNPEGAQGDDCLAGLAQIREDWLCEHTKSD